MLRKFVYEKKLNMAGLFEIYDFIDAPLTIEDLRECNTPKPSARFPSTDPLRINLNNVVVEFEATPPTILSKNITLPSAERIAQKKYENAPTSPIVPRCSDEEAEEDATEDNVVTSDAETSSPSKFGSSSGVESSSSGTLCVMFYFAFFDTC
jgi:hypothetical protein